MKNKILFYCIEVLTYGGGNGMIDKRCPYCKKVEVDPYYAIFRYYDKFKNIIINHSFLICFDCYDKKIYGKSLDELSNIVPMLKMKGLGKDYGRSITLDGFNMKWDDLHISIKSGLKYKVLATDEVKEAYENDIH